MTDKQPTSDPKAQAAEKPTEQKEPTSDPKAPPNAALQASQRTQRFYSKECRGGRDFEGAAIDKAIKAGWVNHPDKVK